MQYFEDHLFEMKKLILSSFNNAHFYDNFNSTANIK